MLDGPTFIECLLGPQPACLTSPGFMTPLVLIAMMIAAGAGIARRDHGTYLRLLKRGFMAALTLLALSMAAVCWLLITDSRSVTTVDTPPMSQMSFIVAAALVGMGTFLLLGVAGFCLGGWLSGRLKQPIANATGLVIAIDGPAASGKGTLAKRIAAHFNLPCLDTGLLYRAVARDVIEAGGKLDDVVAAVAAARSLDPKTLDDSALRGPAAGDAASMVAKIPEVRAALLDYQRTFAAQPGGAVLDGRDIGTVVCPNADIKIYVTATPEERARRRHLEHQSRGETLDYDTVLADILARDARDSGRDIAPMEAASDAVRLDTTTLDADQAFAAALKIITARK
jgi:CMP/dCMP kinase